MSSPTDGADDLYLLAFREGVSVAWVDGVATVLSPGLHAPLRRVSPAVFEGLRMLSGGGATEAAMAARVQERGGEADLPLLFYHLERFKALGFLTFSAHRAGARLATLERTRSAPAEAPAPGEPPRAAVRPGVPEAACEYILSRFACVRRHGGEVVVESPLAHGRAVIHHPDALAVLHALAAPRSAAEIEALFPGAAAVLGLLLGCGAAARAGREGEMEGPALSMWTFHDALFHARSRRGRHVEPLGATFRFAGRLDPLPALKPPMSGPRIDLYTPDIEALKAEDIPLTRALEERRSTRAQGGRPIHARQLGELLYRAARVRGLGTSSGSPSYPTSSRPYPGGGACYELEIYLAVRACEGLGEGLYHYEPMDHVLTTLSGATPAVGELLAGARAAMATAEAPQVLLVMAARFGRVMWKYESMAYATILKDAGVLYQTVYLVATAMGLAVSGLGNGDAERFASAAGLDFFTETSVGEMALGSLPAAGERRAPPDGG